MSTIEEEKQTFTDSALKRAMAPAPLVLGKHTAKAEPPAADKEHGPHKVEIATKERGKKR
jgi:hypothetical protein